MSKLNKIQEKFVRTSKHTTKFANSGKIIKLDELITEYRRVASIFIDYLWNNKYIWIDKDKVEHILDIQYIKYDISNYLDYNVLLNCLYKIEKTKNLELEEKDFKEKFTWLSARVLSSLVTQIASMLKAALEAQEKRWFILNKLSDNKEEIPFKLLYDMIIGEPKKPNTKRIHPEFSSKNVEFIETNNLNNHFNLFIKMKSLGEMKEFYIPLKFHKQSNKWKNQSKRMGSILIKKDNIELRWEFERKKKTEGITVGADQGKNTVLTLSDGQTTPEKDIHGHSLDSIMKKMSRKKKGSNNFKKTQKHRENFTNWSLNQLDLSKINQVNYEEVLNLRFGKSVSRFMSHWTYTNQDNKFQSRCDEAGVQVNHSSSACKSQRCCECGWVHYLNRKGKNFKCRNCSSAKNADLNSSTNHEIKLPDIVDFIMSTRMNRTSGFFWKPEGIFDLVGKEFRVPNTQKNI